MSTSEYSSLRSLSIKHISKLMENDSEQCLHEFSANHDSGMLTRSRSNVTENKSWGGGTVTVMSNPQSFVQSEINFKVDKKQKKVSESTASNVEGYKVRKYIRRIPKQPMTSAEEFKQNQRRERNKAAAARCRQRRVDQTNLLQNETKIWENKILGLNNQIKHLKRRKFEYEKLLIKHSNDKLNVCKKPKIDQNICPDSEPVYHVLRSRSAMTKANDASSNDSPPIHLSRPNTLCLDSFQTNYSIEEEPFAASSPSRCTRLQRQKSLQQIEGVSIDTPSSILPFYEFDIDQPSSHTSSNTVADMCFLPTMENDIRLLEGGRSDPPGL